MVNKMFFELFSEFSTESLYIFNLFTTLLPNLNNLFIYVPTQEVSPLSWIVLSLLHIFCQLHQGLVTLLLHYWHFLHDILNEWLHHVFGLLVRTESRVHFHLYHLWQLLCHLHLLTLEGVHVVTKRVWHLCYLTSQVYLLLGSVKFFLFNPPIDSSDLLLKAILQTHDSFVLPLEFTPHYGVHCCISITHLISVIFGLLTIQLLLHV